MGNGKDKAKLTTKLKANSVLPNDEKAKGLKPNSKYTLKFACRDLGAGDEFEVIRSPTWTAPEK